MVSFTTRENVRMDKFDKYKNDPQRALLYAKRSNRRIPELEPIIMTDIYCVSQYAAFVIKGRWKEAEDYICSDQFLMSNSTNFQNISQVYKYTMRFIGDRWPNSEHLYHYYPEYAAFYSFNIIKERWIEMEPLILNDINACDLYLRKYPEVRTPSRDVPLVLNNVAFIDVSNVVTDEQVVNLFSLKLSVEDIVMPINAQNFQTFRIYDERLITQRLKQNTLISMSINDLKSQELRTFLQDKMHCSTLCGDFE